MARLKWLWWKFWAWLTTPWRPQDVIDNPRSKKRRGDPEWVIFATHMMYAVNAFMMAVIIVSLMLLWAVKQ
jgi:hypothetical protein